jgi:GTPase
MLCREPEKEYGNIEYKLKLINKSETRIKEMTTQIRFRVNEGMGEAIYVLGCTDSGELLGLTMEEYKESIEVLHKISDNNNYSLTEISNKKITEDKSVYELLIRENNENQYIDVKVVISGAVDSGKSTFTSYLVNGKKDNGRGLARLSVFNFDHEIKTGRTSSVAQHILGFDSTGGIVNYKDYGKKSWPEIVNESSKIITFMDLCGHEKYLKTTIRGISSCFPDICLILIGGNMGVSKMTKEHIFLCLTLDIPFAIVITKIDICKTRQNVLKDTMSQIKKILKMPGVRKVSYNVNNKDDAILSAKNINSKSIVPIFQISNVSGEGIDNMKTFLNLLSPIIDKKLESKHVEYHICSTFYVSGVGTVTGGQLISGSISIGDKLLLGPNNNSYETVQVRSIHCKRVPMTTISCGNYVCLGLRKIKREHIKKGNVIVSKGKELLVRKFQAHITVVRTNSTTIKPGYTPVVHTCSVRQSARIISISDKKNCRKINTIDDNILRNGDKANVCFEFCYKDVFIKPGWRIMLAEGPVKVIGIITHIF